MKKEVRFIDLFSGMGGFRTAAESMENWRCVFSCELNETTRKIYKKNFKIEEKFAKDFLSVSAKDIPEFDIMFAGFPCQPFSKAGNRSGFNHEKGNIFNHIIKILKEQKKKPKFIFLENVANIKNHDKGNTYKEIRARLKKIGYLIPETPDIICPTDLGIPQMRKRVYIVAKYLSEKPYNFQEIKNKQTLSPLNQYVKGELKNLNLNSQKIKALKFWKEIIKEFHTDLPKPLWLNYDHEKKHDFPKWKKEMFDKTVKFMSNKKNLKKINKLKRKYNFDDFIESYKKLEWNLANENWSKCILQFRPSGLRFKRFDKVPTLVALNQRPYIPHLNRYITINELLKLHGFKEEYKFNKKTEKTHILSMLGNTVSVDVVKAILNEIKKDI